MCWCAVYRESSKLCFVYLLSIFSSFQSCLCWNLAECSVYLLQSKKCQFVKGVPHLYLMFNYLVSVIFFKRHNPAKNYFLALPLKSGFDLILFFVILVKSSIWWWLWNFTLGFGSSFKAGTNWKWKIWTQSFVINSKRFWFHEIFILQISGIHVSWFCVSLLNRSWCCRNGTWIGL